jgi:hypothetical protein
MISGTDDQASRFPTNGSFDIGHSLEQSMHVHHLLVRRFQTMKRAFKQHLQFSFIVVPSGTIRLISFSDMELSEVPKMYTYFGRLIVFPSTFHWKVARKVLTVAHTCRDRRVSDLCPLVLSAN